MRLAFEQFTIDLEDRRLTSAGEALELNGRYFDALALLVRDSGRLVSKDRFMAEVWRGVPVTDEALTQCIRTLRRQLGDDAARPRFIETVPKHGYRFIAPVKRLEGHAKGPVRGTTADPWREFLLLGGAGTFGGAAAGAIGGLVYGFAAASQSAAGAISVLLVLLSVTMLVAVIGGAGVSFAIAACAFARQPSCQLSTLAGAAGGLITGAIGKLLGHDAFALLVGRAPGEITGAMEGILVGAGVGLGAGLALRSNSLRRGTAVAALTGGLAGVSIALLGGRLMLGSLVLLEQNYPASSLRLGVIAHLFGEERFGPITNMISTTLEGALFAAFVVSAMVLARQSFDRARA